MTLQGLRVLIAEDETLIRLDLRQMLEEHGIEVCGEARDGLEAVEAGARDPARPRGLRPEDAEPRRCGGGAAGLRGAAAPDHHADRVLGPQARSSGRSDAGVFSYLSKPFGPQDVIPAIRAAVARHDDLLTARREVGKREEPIEVEVRSSSGHVWPLRVQPEARRLDLRRRSARVGAER